MENPSPRALSASTARWTSGWTVGNGAFEEQAELSGSPRR